MYEKRTNNDKKIDGRNLSVDLLKIIAMVMVVALHISSHGIKNAEITVGSAVYWFVTVLNTFSLVAVNCFVLTSGYFFSQKAPSPRRIIPLWVQVCTYSVGMYIIMCMIPSTGIQFSVRKLIEYGLPILTNQYWFFKYYVLLLLISPILNHWIRTAEKRQYEESLLLLLLMFSVLPSVNIFGDTFGTASGYSLIWFSILYLIAGYIRKYSFPTKQYFLWYLGLNMFLCMMRICGGALGGVFATFASIQSMYNSPLVVSSSVAIFLGFLGSNWNFGAKISWLLKRISRFSFAVYLFHDHGAFSSILWNEWVRLGDYVDSGMLFVGRAVNTWILIFMCGMVLETVRFCADRSAQSLIMKFRQ